MADGDGETPLDVVILAGRLGLDDDGWPLGPLLDRLEERGIAPRAGCTGRADDREDPRALRRAIALVDAPDISEPEPNVATSGVVAEELMFAGRPPTPFAARRWLGPFTVCGPAAWTLGRVAGTDIGEVDPGTRVRILLELAAMREGVAGIVLVSPDRHGGSPAVWWRLAHEFADRGLAMLVISGVASRMVLDPASPDSVAEPVSRRSRT